LVVGDEGLREDVAEPLDVLRLCSGRRMLLLEAVAPLLPDCSEYERWYCHCGDGSGHRTSRKGKAK
jgi:hypothetical protein